MPPREIGTGLLLGIIFLPIVFAWFTLRAGHSEKQRIIAFCWMAVFFFSMSIGRKDGKSEGTSPAPSPTVQAASTPKPVPPPRPEPRQPALGEDFRLGDFTYNVKSVKVQASVGTGFARKRASEGARFVVVEYTIQNDSNATATVLTDDFRIVDSRSREYHPSSEANTALVMSGGGKDLLLSEVQPGLKKKMQTAFEMPEAAADNTFTLVIPEKGLWGTGSVRITLK